MRRASRSRVLTIAGASLLATLAILAMLVVLSLPVLAQADDPPAQPTGQTGDVSHDQMSLRWDGPGGDSITGYQVLRRDPQVHDRGEFHTIADDTGSPATFHVDTTVEAETRYFYRVKARNAVGLGPQNGFFRADTPAAPPPDTDGTLSEATALRAELAALGLALQSGPHHWLNPLITVPIPGGIENATVRGSLLRDYDIETRGGPGEFRDKAWRNGLMGDSTCERNVFALLSAPEAILNANGYEVACGSSLAAPQKALAAFAGRAA